ncbi:hypothetical protein GYMLUDRAFT_253162 [Collybiopsis luxurians FD-317 M1]|uniref:Uncharacterized protein n=1 Tax=Collybiopsis luxurians FD-317 M1 TaxID=944289 RepID=A0A0D0BXK6_9AGAR|nr:hypothetical protein GYMLUDRAFT_253162 [Collybiopsis luxurians FD-317 M1]
MGNFMFLTHRRAYRQVGLQVKALMEGWGGMTPVQILENCLGAVIGCPAMWIKSFDIPLQSIQYKIVKRYLEVDDKEVLRPGYHRLWISPNNIRQWIALFGYLWEQLESQLLVKSSHPHNTVRTVISTPPDRFSTQYITLLVSVLRSLRPIVKYLFSFPVWEFQHALAAADTRPISEPLTPRRCRIGRASAFSQDQELSLYGFECIVPVVEDLREGSASRVLQCFLGVTKWYDLAYSLSKQAQGPLCDKTIQLNKFCCDVDPYECKDEEVAAVLEAIFSKQPDRQAVVELQNIARSASVHAEAALIGCAYHELMSNFLVSGSQTPVGVSHRCCNLCLWLKEGFLCESNKLGLPLSENHAGFLPWIPPVGLPGSLLRMLRQKLIETIRRRSSGDSVFDWKLEDITYHPSVLEHMSQH